MLVAYVKLGKNVAAHKDAGRQSFYTETLLYVVSPYNYYYYVITLKNYFRQNVLSTWYIMVFNPSRHMKTKIWSFRRLNPTFSIFLFNVKKLIRHLYLVRGFFDHYSTCHTIFCGRSHKYCFLIWRDHVQERFCIKTLTTMPESMFLHKAQR